VEVKKIDNRKFKAYIILENIYVNQIFTMELRMNKNLLINGLMSLALLSPVFASGDFSSDDDQRDAFPPSCILDSSSDDENSIIKIFKAEKIIKSNFYECKNIIDDSYIKMIPDNLNKISLLNSNYIDDIIKNFYINEPVCFTCSQPSCLSERLDDFFEGKKPRVAKLETLLLAPEAMTDGDHLLVLTHLSPLFGTQKNVRMYSPVGDASDASLLAMDRVPNDVWKLVCFHLPDQALVNFAQTCKRFRTVALLGKLSPVRMRVTALGNAIVDQYHDRKGINLPGIIMVDTEVGRAIWPILKKREDSKLTNQAPLLLGLNQATEVRLEDFILPADDTEQNQDVPE